ncbi:MAG: hypothetical protein J6W25_04875 [Bacilli bacterium]|nr:hypothetical protein [Bacilli bacterium]MBO7535697.1 hypothetical protein [Bacilli bacterium]
MKRIISKIFILVLAVSLLGLGLHSKAATGYSYDHNKKIIYSAEGLIYDHSFDGKSLGIGYSGLTSPEDFFIFKHPTTDEVKMYLTDSKANTIYVLDTTFNKIDAYNSFVLDVAKFNDTQLKAMKSNGASIVVSYEKADRIVEDFLKDLNKSIKANGFMPQNGIEISGGTKVTTINASNFYEATKYLLVGSGTSDENWDSTAKGLLEVDKAFTSKWLWYLSYAQSTNLSNEYLLGACNKAGLLYDYSGATAEVYDVSSAKMLANNISNLINYSSETKHGVEGNSYVASNFANKEATEAKLVEDCGAMSLNAIRNAGTYTIGLANPKSAYRSVITKFADESLDNRDFLYICDYDNNQVLCIDSQTLEIKIVITNPNEYENVLVFDAQVFQPQKVVTDNAGRIYVIANSVFEGILQFDADGIYKRFTGVNNVTLTAWDIFWLSVSTEAQYESRKSYINTTFTSMAVDVTGTFIYSTASPITNSNGSVNSTAMIKKLNPAGKDVLRRNGYAPPQGDLTYVADTANGAEIAVGPSSFNAIAVNEYGMYTVVDSKRNRLFTYDNEGHLLYISGESGKYTNVLDAPVAIQYYGDDIIVLDKNTKELKVFVSTEIGGYINKAVELEYKGDIDSAAEYWKKVIKFNANYEYAYVGVGKKYLKDKEYKTAMQYFKNGSNKLQYSEAYKLYRNNIIKKYAPPVLYVIVGLVIVLVVFKIVRKKLGKNKPKEELNMGEDE